MFRHRFKRNRGQCLQFKQCNPNDSIHRNSDNPDSGAGLKMDKLVTCETKDCENENIELLVIDCQELVICGCCNVEITKKTDPKPEPKKTK
jgi:hypothetical protein